MDNLLEKARAGRTNALAGATTTNPNETALKFEGIKKARVEPKIDPIPFISRRAQTGGAAWLH